MYIIAGMHVLYEMFCPESKAVIIHMEIIHASSHLLCKVHCILHLYPQVSIFPLMKERSQAHQAL